MLSGVQRGEVADQYADGAAGRAQQIDDLAADPPAAVEAVRTSNACSPSCSVGTTCRRSTGSAGRRRISPRGSAAGRGARA
jgi:hypothetical protein